MTIQELNEELDKILEDIRNIDYDSSIANKRYSVKDNKGNIIEKGYWQVKSGTTLCGYSFVDSDNKPLLLSKQVAEFIKEVHDEYGGTGMVSSVMDSHNGSPTKINGHPSGNCIDFGLGRAGYNVEAVYKIAVPISKHQAIKEFWFESKPNDKKAEVCSTQVKAKMRENGLDVTKVGYREIPWSSGYHIHVYINPDLLKHLPNKISSYQ